MKYYIVILKILSNILSEMNIEMCRILSIIVNRIADKQLKIYFLLSYINYYIPHVRKIKNMGEES